MPVPLHLRRRRRAEPDRRSVFVRDLRRWHDILATTPLASHYWVWGGIVLGWAREGRLLEHDLVDADFAFRAEHRDLFPAAARALIEGGFAPLYRFANNAGEVTEYSFTRNGGKFEFFVLSPADDGKLRYWVYSNGSQGDGPPTQARAEIVDRGLETFRFLRRRWRKQRDHEAELSELYGDWRTPNADWWYMDDPAIVSREPWNDPRQDWDGG